MVHQPGIGLGRPAHASVVCIEGQQHFLLLLPQLFCKQHHHDPVQNHGGGVPLGDSLLAVHEHSGLAWLDDQDGPILVAVEKEVCSLLPPVSDCPKHGHAGQLVEAISSINEWCHWTHPPTGLLVPLFLQFHSPRCPPAALHSGLGTAWASTL
eukprot:4471683-Ditylum_brightwellii.AAC.1